MEQLNEVLKKYFGYDSFRLGQREVIEDILQGNNVFATLPTGSGKSLCYQLPAFFLEGTIIVVTPLLSLMEDQVKQLKKKGFKKVVAINSFNTADERSQIYHGLDRYKLIYLSPEMLQNKFILQKLKQLHISLFVIDEAHCISQWGHEFRPDYLKLNGVLQQLGEPTTLALTATATPDVQADIINHFENIQFNHHLYPVDRDNIALLVQQVNSQSEKDQFLIETFKQYAVPTIIYFSSKKESERVALLLSESFEHLSVSYYHSDLEPNERMLIQEQFIENQIDIICSTSAFGMGVDKQNIRLVIHYHLPTQIESFIQEIGRAGRDQLSSVSITLIAPGDERLPKRLAMNELPPGDMIETMSMYTKQLNNNHADLKVDKAVIIDNWRLNEVQWRFIKNFFEETDMMVDEDTIDLSKINSVNRQSFFEKVTSRNQYKLRKLNELFDWITTKHCRREQLYKAFQSDVRQPKFHCCDQCGFTLEEWQPGQISRKQRAGSWSEQLSSIMLPFLGRRL